MGNQCQANVCCINEKNNTQTNGATRGILQESIVQNIENLVLEDEQANNNNPARGIDAVPLLDNNSDDEQVSSQNEDGNSTIFRTIHFENKSIYYGEIVAESKKEGYGI